MNTAEQRVTSKWGLREDEYLGITQLREMHSETLDDAEAILNSADDRDLSSEERKAYDGLMHEADHIQDKLRVAELQAKRREEKAASKGFTVKTNRGPETAEVVQTPAPQLFCDVTTGEAIVAAKVDQPLSQQPAEPSTLANGEPIPRFGAWMHSMLAGRPKAGLTESQVQLSAGSLVGGSYLVPDSISRNVIDLARSKTVAFQAGALSFPMTTAEHTLARLSQDLTADWRAEEVAITGSHAQFERLLYKAKTCAFISSVPVELIEDSDNIADILEQSIAAQAALETDQAILFGDGVDEPLGILNHGNGVNSVASVGLPTNWDEVDTAIYELLLDNAEQMNLSMVAHPRTWQTYNALADTTNQPMLPTPWAGDLSKFSTTSLSIVEGAGSNESSAIVGDFSKCLVGMRSELKIEILDSGQYTDSDSTTWNAASQLLRFVRGYFRLDVGLTQPSHFAVMSGITTS